MKIAVCLSGQPRVIEYAIPSILNFFSGEYEFDFFCHSWNYNTYKRKRDNPGIGEFPIWWEDDEEVDIAQLEQSLLRFNPKKYSIQTSFKYLIILLFLYFLIHVYRLFNNIHRPVLCLGHFLGR